MNILKASLSLLEPLVSCIQKAVKDVILCCPVGSQLPAEPYLLSALELVTNEESYLLSDTGIRNYYNLRLQASVHRTSSTNLY